MKSTILFVDGTDGFSPHRINEKPCGGILTSLTYIPQYLAKQGYKVYVGSNYEKEEKFNGVQYINKLEYGINPDLVVYNRNLVDKKFTDMYGCPKIWWLHDIVQFDYVNDDGFRYIDKIVALSEYCRECYSDFYDIPKYKFSIIPNGVDKDIFYFNGGERNKNLFICASAPVKGLYPLEFTYHNLKRHNPDIELRIYCSQKLHDLKDDRKTEVLFKRFKEQGIQILDPIPQKELADVMRQARAMLMPNHYPEICSNLLLQAQACGLPVVTVPIGSAPEFIEHEKTGLLTKNFPHDIYWWHKDYALNAVNIMKDDELFKYISRNAPLNVKSWSYIGLMWENLIKELI